MKIQIITSCTGEKKLKPKNQLMLSDFRKGPEHVKLREAELKEYLLPAGRMYTGQQHLRLMHGVRGFRERKGAKGKIDLWILSAGYGLIPEDRNIAPYESTFQGMKAKEIRNLADQLNVPAEFRKVTSGQYDVGLILLGDSYLHAASLDQGVQFGGPTILFCSTGIAKKLPHFPNVNKVRLSNSEAKRFSCGLVALKGEMATRVLAYLDSEQHKINELSNPRTNILDLLDGKESPLMRTTNRPARSNPGVNKVIEIPESWWHKPHRDKLQYFIPEWDDLVDPDYDFEHDLHSGGSGDWSNEVYAHQMYPEPNYDGILMSRAVAEKSKKKTARLAQMGVHRYLRVPREFPIMGDCGAFDYIEAKEPPYTSDDVLNYYTRLGFDFGVSVDHLIVPAFESEKKFRYELTIHNAEEFIRTHRKQGLKWEPIGAVQGWDSKAYADAAVKYVKMGYRHIGLGGLVRSATPDIMRILKKVREVVPPKVRIHVFGFSRFDALSDLVRLGANSVDSASMLRKAWLGANLNYLMADGWYSAIRVPQANGSFRAKKLIDDGAATLEQIQSLEQSCLSELKLYAKSQVCFPPKSLLDHLYEYDALIAGHRKDTRDRIRRTLEFRPWARCSCAICKKWGIEVVVFRGNNRNRRRGFHNTYVFYHLLQKLVDGERIPWIQSDQPKLPLLELASL